MKRIAIAVALMLAFKMSAASAQELMPPIDKLVEAKTAFYNGDVQPYGTYLESLLAQNRYRLQEEESRFNEAKIKESILHSAREHSVRLTAAQLEERVAYARQLMRKHGQLKMIRDKIRELCDSLALYYSVRVDDDAALRYRKCAAED